MHRESSILVAIFHHPIARSNVTVIECSQQSISALKTLLKLPEDYIGRVHSPGKVVFAPAAAWNVIWAFIMAVAWAAAVTLAVYYLTQGLFDQDVPDKKDRPSSQSFGWNPFTIRGEGMPRPMSYGTNMHYGNIVAKWTDVDGNGDEVLYMILDYGDGPIKGRGANIVYIDDQPVGNFPGISIQDRLGTLNQTCMTGFEEHKNEYRPAGMVISNDGGPLTWTTPNKNFNDIEYTLEWPRGLWYYDDQGEQHANGVGVKVEISKRGLSSWTTIMDTTVTANDMASIYKAYSANEQVPGTVERGYQYDLKITKTSSDKGVDRWGDEMALRAVREVIDVAFTRPGKALLGITALATERLSGRFNVRWVSDDKLCEIFNGTSWEVKWTRNRAWVYLAQLTQPVISGDGDGNPWTIERYEGLDPHRIDLAFIYEWAEWCSQQVDDGNGSTEDRMTCDIICDYETNVWSLSYEIAQIGRMYPYWQGHILTGWVDRPTEESIDLITMDNTMVRSWKSGHAGYGEMSGAAEIFYKDSLQGYERKSLPIPNEDAGSYKRPIAIEGVGITSHSLAARVGNHVMQRNKFIKNINSVRMFKDALRYRLGRVVRLQATVPNWGQSFRVIKTTGEDTVELDRTINASNGELLFVKSYDEVNKQVVMNSYTVASTIGKFVTITETWSVTAVKNNICAIGKAGAIKLRRIIKMKASVENYFDVELETYDTNLFLSDDLPLYIDNPDYVWPAPASELIRPLTTQQVRGIVSQMLPPRLDIEIPMISNCDWNDDTPGAGSISWSKRDAAKSILFGYRGTSYAITPDNTAMEFIYWDPNFTTQFRETNDPGVALATGMWLVCTNKAGVAHPCQPFQLLHAAILLAGTIRAQHYLELRNTYVYNAEDSLDNSKPFETRFKIVSELNAIVSIKLSFSLMPYRAYSTAAASGGAATSGDGGQQTSSGGGTGWWDYTEYETALAANTDSSKAIIGSSEHTGYEDGCDSPTSSDDGTGYHDHSIYSRSHQHDIPVGTGIFDGHVHGQNEKGGSGHRHVINLGDHTHTVDDHTHSTPNHVHGVTYGIHEESNSPTVHYHINNGAGYGGPSGNFNADETDINISGSISGAGWKGIRFDTNLRCRIAVIIECKLDIDA